MIYRGFRVTVTMGVPGAVTLNEGYAQEG